MACPIIQIGKNRRLNPEGQEALRQFAMDILRGREFSLSEKIGILKGFNVYPLGFEDLQVKLPERQFVAVVNHFAECPLGIVGNAVVLSHAFREKLNVEPFIVFGSGKSIVSLFRERAEKTTNVVLVGGNGGGSKIIKQQLEKGHSLILYPEGKNSHRLKRGDFRAGRLMVLAADMDIPVLAVGTYFENNTFYTRAGRILDKQEIIRLGNFTGGREEKREAGQQVVDYGMHEIAATLPGILVEY